MGRLAGFKYTDVARKLRTLGFRFDRQARGSHEIWRHEVSGRKTTLVRHARPIAGHVAGHSPRRHDRRRRFSQCVASACLLDGGAW